MTMPGRTRRRTAHCRDERGVEAVTMLIVLPFLIVLVLGLIDVGFMVSTRLRVTGVVSDAARAAAFDGGNYNPRLNSNSFARDTEYTRRLVNASGRCIPSRCLTGAEGGRPTINCTPNIAARAGDTITCTVRYAYKPLNGPLLNGPLGLGIGTLLKPFTVQIVTRSETGANG